MADNENINFTTDIIDTEIYEQDVGIIDETKDVVVETEIKTIEVFETDVDMVESDSAFSPIGEANEALRHTLLTERDVSDQHPITAITGLRNELDGIKALKTVYADKMGIANYYKWNNGAYNEYGYFVSLVPHTSAIKICDGADIFGVTVDTAGFIGGQDVSVPRDNTYALVVTSGLVSVRCETTVVEGDYVVSNAHGRAEKTDSGCGYKVVTIENKNGTNYALISLGVQACTTDMLGQQIQYLDERVDNAEGNIIEAMNAANAAYKKAGEIGVVSKEAIKNALEALNKSNETDEKVDRLEQNVTDANQTAAQARGIADSAVTTAITVKDEAVATANDAWAKSENVSQEFQSLTAKIDQYSVGEYSQAYGLTLEQARSILKIGMIYVPTKHLDTESHTEVYLYTDENGKQQELSYDFTPGNHYEWNGSIWVEYGDSVAFFSEEPIPSNALQYWYVDSNEAPEGYEAHALYMYDGEQWVKVNILEGNVNNRMTSMLRQTTDRISAEVVNARGSTASLGARITETEAVVENTALWAKGKSAEGEELYNIATVKQTASEDGSNLALVVADTNGNKVVNGASIILNNDNNGSSISLDADYINFDGFTTFVKTDEAFAGTTSINGACIQTKTLTAEQIDVTDLSAFGATIGGWKIDANGIHSNTTSHIVDLWAPNNKPDESAQWIFMFTDNTGAQPTYPFVVKKDGTLIANKATIAGDSNIGGWTISGTAGLIQENDSFKVHIKPPTAYGGLGTAAADFIVLTDKTGDKDTYPFVISSDGTVKATKAIITGNSVIEGDCTVRGKLDGAGLVKLHSSTDVINGLIDFNTTERDGEVYGTIKMLIYYDGWQEDSDTDNNRFRGGVSITGSPVYDTGPWVTISGGRVAIDAHIYDTGNASVYSETNTIETSDQNLKNTITSISSSYSALFDSLRPVTFKFNNGTSDRLHTGFIAQEVDEAIYAAGLTRQDFAGLCIRDEGTEDERWGLRYGEFVALNTYEIQKLKARVAELEAKLENKEN